mmetsp:Transcript_33796/g.85566  ORF Transcript_33796/g.85566 Transcript_33796/m.85566 type:complete len:381 (-) Transcript_33796:552-1694(-)
MSSSEASNSGSDSDLDDVPLYFAEPAPTPRSKPPGLGFSLSAIPSSSTASAATNAPLQSPRPSSRVPGLSLGKIPGGQPHTPDPSVEPLPSSRGAPPNFKLSLPPRVPEPVAGGEDSRLDRTTSATDYGGLASPLPPGPTPRTVSAPHPELKLAASGAGIPPLPTSKLHKPPKLFLQDPATASPSPSPLAAINPSAAELTSLASSTDRVVVSLLSSAFAVSRAAPAATSTSSAVPMASPTAATIRDTVAHRCANGLGIAVDELRFFALTELPPGEEVPASTRHVAVLVNNSGFSLPALETMLSENQALQALQQTNANTIANMHSDYKASTTEVARLSRLEAEQRKELEALRRQAKEAAEAAAKKGSGGLWGYIAGSGNSS